MGGTALYESDPNKLKSAEIRLGLQIWRSFHVFAELIENQRWEKEEVVMAEFAPLARLGSVIPNRLLDKLNERVMLSNIEASRKAHRDALWLCYSNEEVSEINKEQTDLLRMQGQQKYTIWAK